MANKTPLKSIRDYCVECCNGQFKEVRLCPADECSLRHFRSGKRTVRISTLKSIKQKCIDCVGTSALAKICDEVSCPLHAYRNGRNIKRKGLGGNFPTSQPNLKN